jgi:hypothetical protein
MKKAQLTVIAGVAGVPAPGAIARAFAQQRGGRMGEARSAAPNGRSADYALRSSALRFSRYRLR